VVGEVIKAIRRRLHRPEWHPEYGAGPVVCWLDHKLWPCEKYMKSIVDKHYL
jgi:hypothetical protein